MAKKIRFPLEMESGLKVNNVQELKENFYLPQVMVYFTNGSLVSWLRDRYEEDLADEVDALQKEDNNVAEKLCDIFGVEYDADSVLNMESVAERERKRSLLKEVTTDQKVIDAVDQVAFTQDDLYDLLDDNKTEIYLCGESFRIPLAKQGIKYYGVNTPTVIIDSSEEVDWEERNITLENVKYDDKYQEILASNMAKNEEAMRESDDCFPCILKTLQDNDSTSVYIVREIVAKNVKDAKSYGNFVYYIASDEDRDGACSLHVYDYVTRVNKVASGKIECISSRRVEILDCTDRWIACHVSGKKTYVFIVDDNIVKRYWITNADNAIIIRDSIYCLKGERQKLYKLDLENKSESEINLQMSLSLKYNRVVERCDVVRTYGSDSKILLKNGEYLMTFLTDGNNIYFIKLDEEIDTLEDSCELPYRDFGCEYGAVFYCDKIYCFGKNDGRDQLVLYCFDTSTHEINVLETIRINPNIRYGSLFDAEYKVNFEVDNHVLHYKVYEKSYHRSLDHGKYELSKSCSIKLS